MYMRNRYYDPKTGQFTQADPIGLAGGLNAYGFAAGDPVTFADPYGLDAIYIAYPDYRVSAGPFGRRQLGHAAVISIDDTGRTRYYEYGRYDSAHRGIVRRRSVPDVVMENGRATEESLQRLYAFISREYGQGGRVTGRYSNTANADAVNDYAEQRMNDPNRPSYNLLFNNCYDLAQNAVRAGERATERGEYRGNHMYDRNQRQEQ